MRTRTARRGLLALAVPAVGLFAWSTLAAGADTNTLLTAQLSGRNEVGPPGERVGDKNGTGEAFVFGIDGDPTTLCYVIVVNKIAPAVAAHIHMAPEGVNGPVVVNLAAPNDGSSADCVSESESGIFVGVTAAQVLANPAGFYVNVHTPEHQAGAVRGQLSKATP